MLIQFQVKNFRSLRHEQTLSMVATRGERAHEKNTFDSGLHGVPRLLKTTAVYGPNAAGKSNLLKALHFMQALVVNSASAAPGTPVPYSPFNFARSNRNQPTEFVIIFVEAKVRYEYAFKQNATRIIEERLTQYITNRGRMLFRRRYNEKNRKDEWKFSPFLKGPRGTWSESTRPNALFLSTASQLNSEQLLPVFQWFQKRLVVLTGGTQLNPGLTIQLLDTPEGKKQLLPFLREADLGISDVKVNREIVPGTGGMVFGAFIEQKPNGPAHIVRITFEHYGDDKHSPPLQLADESSGTQIFFATAGAWLNVFANAEVLLMDEIDTSLHPLLTQFLIKKFHSSESNPKNAQLVFTTHNTTLLDQKLFRRDQIWFVEKDRVGASKLYPLADFKIRTGEAIEKWYLHGRYGALPILSELDT
jgi:AAA15 family ATPase/GTPase